MVSECGRWAWSAGVVSLHLFWPPAGEVRPGGRGSRTGWGSEAGEGRASEWEETEGDRWG